jgi:dCMP deaminase
MNVPDGMDWPSPPPVRQEKWDMRFLEMAHNVSGWSKDPNTKVGAVMVRDMTQLVSVGFNGFAQRMPDLTENLFNRDEKNARIVHAEINAMIFARGPVEGMTLYSTHLPCQRCAPFIIQFGVARVVSMKPTGDYLLRWGTGCEMTRVYFAESKVELVEYAGR